MRFHFPNLTRPKKAAKHLSSVFPDISLSSIQRAVAVACGYRDWHELEVSHAAAEPTMLDEYLTEGAFRERAIALSRSLAAALNVLDGDVQAGIDAVVHDGIGDVPPVVMIGTADPAAALQFLNICQMYQIALLPLAPVAFGAK